MFRRLLNRIKCRVTSLRDYEKSLERYRRNHPESLEEEQEQIRQWLARAAAQQRQKQVTRDETDYSESVRVAQALYELKEVARAAFMRHPAATESDFRRCWPSIREEMLKQSALEELASDPTLSQALATQVSEATQRDMTDSSPSSPTLQLLKKPSESD